MMSKNTSNDEEEDEDERTAVEVGAEIGAVAGLGATRAAPHAVKGLFSHLGKIGLLLAILATPIAVLTTGNLAGYYLTGNRYVFSSPRIMNPAIIIWFWAPLLFALVKARYPRYGIAFLLLVTLVPVTLIEFLTAAAWDESIYFGRTNVEFLYAQFGVVWVILISVLTSGFLQDEYDGSESDSEPIVAGIVLGMVSAPIFFIIGAALNDPDFTFIAFTLYIISFNWLPALPDSLIIRIMVYIITAIIILAIVSPIGEFVIEPRLPIEMSSRNHFIYVITISFGILYLIFG